jgi:hypothetical protein
MMKSAPDFRRDDDDPPRVVSPRNIALPLWFSWGITTTFVAATVYLVTTLNDIKTEIKSVGSDRWRKSFMREWASRLQQENTSLKVPSPDQVSKDLD